MSFVKYLLLWTVCRNRPNFLLFLCPCPLAVSSHTDSGFSHVTSLGLWVISRDIKSTCTLKHVCLLFLERSCHGNKHVPSTCWQPGSPQLFQQLTAKAWMTLSLPPSWDQPSLVQVSSTTGTAQPKMLSHRIMSQIISYWFPTVSFDLVCYAAITNWYIYKVVGTILCPLGNTEEMQHAITSEKRRHTQAVYILQLLIRTISSLVECNMRKYWY